VVLIGRPQLVEAVERQGLRLETQTFDEHVRVSASTEGSAVQGAQLVLFCVKSTDTESGAAAIKPHLALDAVVLSLQNGGGFKIPWRDDRRSRFRGTPAATATATCVEQVLNRVPRQDHDHSSAVLTVLQRGPTPERPRTRP